MVQSHAALASGLAARLGLDPATQDAVGASYERWDGRGWPGALSGDRIPLAARICQLAEHVEVAHRVGGVRAATTLAQERSGTQFDPGAGRPPDRPRGGGARRPRLDPGLADGDRGRALPEPPAAGRPGRPSTGRRGRLRRPQVAVHAGALARGGRPGSTSGPGGSACPRTTWRCSVAPAWSTTWAGSGSPTRSGTSPARWAPASRSASGCTPT